MNSMEDGGYLHDFYKQTQSTETTPHLCSPPLVGMCTPSAGCPERTFARVPSVPEPVLFLHGLQVSLICKLWLRCTSIKNNNNSALWIRQSKARHSISAGMEGDMHPQSGVYHTYVTRVQPVLPANHTGMPHPQHLPFRCGVPTIQGVQRKNCSQSPAGLFQLLGTPVLCISAPNV